MIVLHDLRAATHASRRRLAAAIGFACLLGAPAAWADCQADIGGLMSRRMTAITAVNKAKTKEGKLDPTLACPRLRTLSALETETSAYLTKNKDWCNVPDDFMEKMVSSAKRTASFATQACAFAVKVKQMQQQQAQQQQTLAPKLPAGPL